MSRRFMHLGQAGTSTFAARVFAIGAVASILAPSAARADDEPPPAGESSDAASPPEASAAAASPSGAISVRGDSPPSVGPVARGTDATSAPDAFSPWPTARLALELEVFSSARRSFQDGDDLSELRLDRGELGARVAITPRAAAELRVEAIRSAGEGGALGVDGNSTVVRVKYAQVMGTLDAGPVRLDGALGFVPDPWIRTLEDGYQLRPLSRVGSERLLGWPTADLSAQIRGSFGPARLTVAVGNGEGLRYPERNRGKTTTAVLEVVPLHTRSLRVSIAGVGRDGSLGAASVRDRRAGGGATVTTPYVRAGGEVVRAWGLGDRGEVEGTELAGWLEVTPNAHLSLAARGSTLGVMDGRASSFGGAIAASPWIAKTGDLRVWLAVDRQTTSGTASPLPGVDPGDATVVMLIASATANFLVEPSP